MSKKTKKDLVIHLGIITGITLVLIVLFFYVYLPLTTNHGEKIMVPDIKGKNIEEASKILESANLSLIVNDSTYVDGAVPNSVISQHPLSGSQVKANRKIYIIVTSTNPPLVAMPDLVDRSLKDAEFKIKALGLVLGGTVEVPSRYKGPIVRQLVNGQPIPKDTPIPKGTKITLEIGNGLGGDEPDSLAAPDIDDAGNE